MMNNTMLVGRLTKDPEVIETENGKRVSNIAIAVPRPYKNEEGVYETDFIEVTMWNNIADNATAYCKKGDIVGVKGRIQVDTYEKDGERKYIQKVVAEKLTFLTPRAKEEPEAAL